ncbi:hypothetical protein WR25_08113 [Diploscapter pachys]|uniref:EGF-like domain-containing protein n=1 Tax=Diploscapter pachys TaxID=2018661 RepID=A0A2A2JMW7_9BILA|nr:hypothetical protein WR25_08113 [Diploscapter pachys]
MINCLKVYKCLCLSERRLLTLQQHRRFCKKDSLSLRTSLFYALYLLTFYNNSILSGFDNQIKMASLWYLIYLSIVLTGVQSRIYFLDKSECKDLDYCNDRGLCWNDYPKIREAHCLCMDPYEGDKCERARLDDSGATIKSASRSIRNHRSRRTSEDMQTDTARQRRQRAAKDESNNPGMYKVNFR